MNQNSKFANTQIANTKIEDLNTTTIAWGYYDTSTSNVPPEYSYGLCHTFERMGTGSSQWWRFQIAYPANTGKAICQRYSADKGATWSAWEKMPTRSEMDSVRKATSAFGVIPPFSSINVGANKKLVLTMSNGANTYRGFLFLLCQGNGNANPQVCMFSWGNNSSTVQVNHIVGNDTNLDGANIDGSNLNTIKVSIPMLGYSTIIAFANANVTSGVMTLEDA